VRVGHRVQAGQYIARSGNTGEFTSAPHLHFELWDLSLKNVKGVWGRIDPTPFMEEIQFVGGFGDRDIDGEPEDDLFPAGDEAIHEAHSLEDGGCVCGPFVPDFF
jgi:murein DD-endopeptidase MepM/ murein hydrolase activator NlpD